MKFKTVGRGFKQRWFVDGVEMGQAEYDLLMMQAKDRLPRVSEDGPCSLFGWKPLLSDALAVHPEQIPEVMERNRKHGLHMDYEASTGRPIITSRQQRNELLNIENAHDRDGGYGDR